MPNPSSQPHGETPVKPPLRILHIEDDPTDAELIRLQFQRQGIHCRIARVATRAAFEAALGRPAFDLILSDSRLPAFDGLSALALAAEKSPGTPFIFVTGNNSEKAIREALDHGATGYVLKNNLAGLLDVVRQACPAAGEDGAR